MPIIQSNFNAAWWLRNPHLQTLWASKMRRVIAPQQVPERIELADGDFVDSNWSHKFACGNQSGNDLKDCRGIVCLFHGLGGSLQSAYASATFIALEKAGFAVAFMHFRGCSGEPNRLARAYHSGDTGDIRYFINLVAERFPQLPVHAVGFSLGANALLKYLGEEGSHCPLKSAVAVAPPLVLQEGANKLNKGFGRVYQRYLLNAMKHHLEEKRKRYPALELPDDVSAMTSFWEFDNEVTARLHGFADVHDYYTKSSSRQYLPSIDCRTHIIHALDDPFFTPAIVPDASELAAHTTLELCTHGGHVGFVSGKHPLATRFWLNERIPKCL